MKSIKNTLRACVLLTLGVLLSHQPLMSMGEDPCGSDAESDRQRVPSKPLTSGCAVSQFFDAFTIVQCFLRESDDVGVDPFVEQVTLTLEERISAWLQDAFHDQSRIDREIARLRTAICRVSSFIAARSMLERDQIDRLLALGQAIHAQRPHESQLWEFFIGIVERNPAFFGEGIVYQDTALANFIDHCLVPATILNP